MRYILSISALILLLLIALTFSSKELFEDYHPIEFLLFFGVLPFYTWQNMSNFLYSAQQITHVHDKAIFISRTLQLMALCVSGLFGASLKTFLFLYSLTSFAIFYAEYLLLLKYSNTSLNTSDYGLFDILKSMLRSAKWPFLDSLALSAPPLAIFIVGLQTSREELGHYSFALQILATFYFPFTVMQIKLQEKLTATSWKGADELIKKSLFYVLPASIFIAITAPLVSYLLPVARLSNFQPSMPIMNSLLFTIPLAGFYAVFQAIWIGLHRSKLSSMTNLLAGAINIGIVLLFTKDLGVYAGVTGTYLSYSVALLAQLRPLKLAWAHFRSE
ncbi:hypothetical protein [Bdellovibrio sp.]|uniref:hypothetical protein n=1 Tax=Bdellovibrio sp. TaxID=28201 RepID=UPI0039E41467